MLEIEVFILVDENGDYVVSPDKAALIEDYANAVGGDLGELASRLIAVKFMLPAPSVTEVSATLPESNNQPIEIAVKEPG